MEKRRPGTHPSSLRVSVDLPEPEGAEMMKTAGGRVVIRGASFQIERLLANLFDRRLGQDRQFRDPEARFARAAGLRKNRIGLAIHFLQQEIQLLAGFAAGLEYAAKLARMDFQAGKFFADVAAIGQD